MKKKIFIALFAIIPFSLIGQNISFDKINGLVFFSSAKLFAEEDTIYIPRISLPLPDDQSMIAMKSPGYYGVKLSDKCYVFAYYNFLNKKISLKDIDFFDLADNLGVPLPLIDEVSVMYLSRVGQLFYLILVYGEQGALDTEIVKKIQVYSP